MKNKVVKVLAIIAIMFAISMVSGCFIIFPGPDASDSLNQDTQDANFDFNHMLNTPNTSK